MRRYIKHTSEFRVDAVKLAMRGDRTIRQVAQDLDLPYGTVWSWCRRGSVAKKAKQAHVVAPAAAETAEHRLKRLEVENERLPREIESLKVDREILKKAAAFFAKESE